MKIIALILLFQCTFVEYLVEKTPILTLTVTNFESNAGKGFVRIKKSDKTIVKQLVCPIVGKQIQTQINDLQSGTYSVEVYHDKNNNQRLDKNLLGIPSEKIGVSNNIKIRLLPPTFEQMKFELTQDKHITIRLEKIL